MTLKEQLILHEGLRLKPYRCTAGRLTIGVGRNLDDKGISEAEAMDMLSHDIMETYNGLRHVLPWFDNLDDDRQRVLVDLAFNMGLVGLLRFQRMLDAMKRQDWAGAVKEMRDSLWAKQVQKDRVERLVKMMRG